MLEMRRPAEPVQVEPFVQLVDQDRLLLFRSTKYGHRESREVSREVLVGNEGRGAKVGGDSRVLVKQREGVHHLQ